jgi:excisionase family DNA binding protein
MLDDFNPTEWTTTAEAARLSGYHAVHIRRLIRQGDIEGRMFGHVWMVSRRSLQNYLREMERLGTAKHDPTRRKDTE